MKGDATIYYEYIVASKVMNRLKKVLICLSLVCCLGVGAVGCGGGSTGSEQGGAVTTTGNNNSADVGDATEDDGGSDANSSDDSSSDGDSQASETVALTDTNGSVITDDNGNVVTQVVVNTESANDNSTTTANDSSNEENPQNSNVISITEGTDANGNTVANTENTQLYFAKNRYSVILWLADDAKNVYDSGAVAEYTFKVQSDAPDGTYPIEIDYGEFTDQDGNDVSFTVQNGTLTVGQPASVSEQGAAASGVSLRVDNATAQPGDTFKIKLYVDNNTGFAVTRVELKYDSKIMEVESIASAGILANYTVESNLNNDKSVNR